MWTAGVRGCRCPRRCRRRGRRVAVDAPSRSRRARHLGRRQCRVRVQPAVHHRHRALTSAAAVGPPETPDRYVLVFNGEIYNYLELRSELAASHGAVFATDGDGEAIIAAYHHWGVDALAGCGVCSRSPSGTLSLANCSAPVILSASNRCSSRPEAVASRWLARRSACWSLRR
ncbi:glutamine amidotransferase domain protein [Mycobacterium xenopi 4042]|uniref:asparagine synthase (glutamine-hydrolyzing) n=1 Tax=Mycobacterium xenopi 4042 TaxID=1299334 RepID=X8DBA3_MYCXE|nr:glutamine amidotransferase domain protein [Mycobacterium xenopi 4042]